MRKKTSTFLLFNILIVVCLFCGCFAAEKGNTAQTAVTERSLFAMDTYMNLRAYGEQAETALIQSCEKITELEELFSVTKEGSDIWRINQAEGNVTEVGEDTASILRTAIAIGDETQGALDITLYPVLKEWGFTTEKYRIPTEEELQSLLEYVDYKQIELEENQVRIPKGTEIDFGALAKGYTSDRIIEILKENGVESALINLGGNVHTLGTKPDGSLWKIGIRNPFETGEMCILSAADQAVITSGNYERYFTGEDGKEYWHILDAADGYPADNGLVSVTIIGEEGVRCDALSTALFVAGLEHAADYWRDKQDFDMILVTEDGKLYITEGIKENLKNVSKMPMEIMNKKEP